MLLQKLSELRPIEIAALTPATQVTFRHPTSLLTVGHQERPIIIDAVVLIVPAQLRSHRSDRYKISELMTFIAGRPLPVDSPSLPFCMRFNVSLQTRRHKWRHVPYRDVAILDTEPVASSYSDGNPTRLSSNHFQSARALHCYISSFKALTIVTVD